MVQGRHPLCKESKDGRHEWNDSYFCIDTHNHKVLCDYCGYCPEDRTYHLIQEGSKTFDQGKEIIKNEL